jgi:GTP-binding protein
MDGSDPLTNYDTIRDELVQYDSRLGERPEIVAVTKAELPGAGEVQAALAARTGKEVLLISAVTGQGLNQLVHAIANALQSRELETTAS